MGWWQRIYQTFFFPQLGCLRLQQELLNTGEEKLLRMQDLIKSLTKLAVRVMHSCILNSRSGPTKTLSLSGWCEDRLLGSCCLKSELKGKEAFHYLHSPRG